MICCNTIFPPLAASSYLALHGRMADLGVARTHLLELALAHLPAVGGILNDGPIPVLHAAIADLWKETVGNDGLYCS